MSRLRSSDSSDSDHPHNFRSRKRKITHIDDSSSSESSSSESEEADEELITGDADNNQCSICLGEYDGKRLGIPENCKHIFCLECIQEWAKNINTCPVDRRFFNNILVKSSINGPIIEEIYVEDKAKEEPEEVPPTFCEVCEQCDREDEMLLCDECDKGYHLDCLRPALQAVPIDEWYCPECSAEDADKSLNVSDVQPPCRRQRDITRIPQYDGSATLGEVALGGARAGPSNQSARTAGSRRRRSLSRRRTSRDTTTRNPPRRKKRRRKKSSSSSRSSSTSKKRSSSTRKSSRKTTRKQKKKRLTRSENTDFDFNSSHSSYDPTPRFSVMGNQFSLNTFEDETDDEDTTIDSSNDGPTMNTRSNENRNRDVLDEILTDIKVLGSRNIRIERSGKLRLQTSSSSSDSEPETSNNSLDITNDSHTETDTSLSEVNGKERFPLSKRQATARENTRIRIAMIRSTIQKQQKPEKKHITKREPSSSPPNRTINSRDDSRFKNFKIPKRQDSSSTATSSTSRKEQMTPRTKAKNSNATISINRIRQPKKRVTFEQSPEKLPSLASSAHNPISRSISREEDRKRDAIAIAVNRDKAQQERRNNALIQLLKQQKDSENDLQQSIKNEAVVIQESPVSSKKPSNGILSKNNSTSNTCYNDISIDTKIPSLPSLGSVKIRLPSVSAMVKTNKTMKSNTTKYQTTNQCYISSKPVAIVTPSVSGIQSTPTKKSDNRIDESKRHLIYPKESKTVSSSSNSYSSPLIANQTTVLISEENVNPQRKRPIGDIVNAIKPTLRSYFTRNEITKEQYKIIMKKCVDKIKASEKEIIQHHVIDLVKKYVKRIKALE